MSTEAGILITKAAEAAVISAEELAAAFLEDARRECGWDDGEDRLEDIVLHTFEFNGAEFIGCWTERGFEIDLCHRSPMEKLREGPMVGLTPMMPWRRSDLE